MGSVAAGETLGFIRSMGLLSVSSGLSTVTVHLVDTENRLLFHTCKTWRSDLHKSSVGSRIILKCILKKKITFNILVYRKGREEGEDPGKDAKRKQKEIFKCWEWEDGESWWQIGQNGRTLFDGPSPQWAVVPMEEEQQQQKQQHMHEYASSALYV